MFRALAGFIYFKLLGWRVEDHRPPGLKQYIVVVAPHTSNWDFPIGVLVRSICRMNDVRYLAKKSLFKPPFGWLFRLLGGYPVDRSVPHHLVDQVTDYFRTIPDFKLAITPEGTRKRVDKWKTGFHRIARQANVPVILAAMDYGNKVVSFTDVFPLTDDLESDIERMKQHYRPIRGKNPDQGVF
ncbi:MAG: 1-acyl-sn-glycerol-3-phosphate acyltransferase [Flavobacteriales bacterium]|nr:1-acyl-sn-glycerol-3-phosphate acyltransferase [Flavobacteriales bacterium]